MHRVAAPSQLPAEEQDFQPSTGLADHSVVPVALGSILGKVERWLATALNALAFLAELLVQEPCHRRLRGIQLS